jgi:hypothetical protein
METRKGCVYTPGKHTGGFIMLTEIGKAALMLCWLIGMLTFYALLAA